MNYKAAIIQLTKYFANYMSDYNINVNCISPGGVKNEYAQTKSFIKDIQKEFRKWQIQVKYQN